MFRSYAAWPAGLSALARAGRAASPCSITVGLKILDPALAFLLLIIEYANLPPWRKLRPILPTQAHLYLSEKAQDLKIADYFPKNFNNITTIRRRMNNRLLTGREMEAHGLVTVSRPNLLQRLRFQGVSYAILPPDRLRLLRDKGLRPMKHFDSVSSELILSLKSNISDFGMDKSLDSFNRIFLLSFEPCPLGHSSIGRITA